VSMLACWCWETRESCSLSLHDALPISNDQGVVRCELGELAAGSNVTVRIVVEARALGSLTNVVRVSGTEADLEPANNAMSAVTQDRKSTRLNSSHVSISYAVSCLKKKR